MLRFVRGWVCIMVTGCVPERFFNLCRNRGMVLWDVVVKEDGYCCSMYREDYLNCQDLIRKAGVTVQCREEHGLYVYIRRYRHRQAFFAACLFLFFAIWFSTLHLWEIRITDNLYYSEDQILSCLKEHGVQAGIRKNKIDCEKVEQLLRDTFERISWSAATVDGTVLQIAIAENYGTLEAVMADTEPVDLVAEMDGVVQSLVVRKGIAQVKPGDTVTKGQILISGSVPRHNDAQEITGYEFVHADGEVLLKTELSYEDFCEQEKQEKTEMKGKGSIYHICIAGKELKIWTPVRAFWYLAKQGQKGIGVLTGALLEKLPDSVYEKLPASMAWIQTAGSGTEAEPHAESVGSGYERLEFPEAGFSIYTYKEEKREFTIRHTWISESEATGILQKKLNRFLEELEKNKDVVVENQVRIYYDSVGYRAKGKIVVLRPQAGHQSINYSEYETETMIEDESD